jgi:hypothetical protein
MKLILKLWVILLVLSHFVSTSRIKGKENTMIGKLVILTRLNNQLNAEIDGLTVEDIQNITLKDKKLSFIGDKHSLAIDLEENLTQDDYNDLLKALNEISIPFSNEVDKNESKLENAKDDKTVQLSNNSIPSNSNQESKEIGIISPKKTKNKLGPKIVNGIKMLDIAKKNIKTSISKKEPKDKERHNRKSPRITRKKLPTKKKINI